MMALKFVLATFMMTRSLEAQAKPNIIMVVADDWGWSNVGFHANEFNRDEVRTPNIDKLAVEEGVILDRYYAPRMCGPSRNSMFSGRNPIHNSYVNSPMGDIPEGLTRDDYLGNAFDGTPLGMTIFPEKLREAGYATAFYGKWDIGQATNLHYPIARGFDKALSFQSFTIDPWTYKAGIPYTPNFGLCNSEKQDGVFPVFSYLDLFKDDLPAFEYEPASTCSDTTQTGCVPCDDIFVEEAIATINNHDPEGKPLFLTLSPHSLHTPLAPPDEYSEEFAFITDDVNNQATYSRRQYAAMVSKLDTEIGELVDALKAKGMWDNTLLAMFSDNGGPIYIDVDDRGVESYNGGANNYPLRGGKLGNAEGGIRVNSFVSGGFVPEIQRGKTIEGFMATEDWYATFCNIAGISSFDQKGNLTGQPPIDSLDLWPYISGEVPNSPREEVYLSAAKNSYPGVTAGDPYVQAFIDKEGYKLVTGQIYDGVRTGPIYPNATSFWKEFPSPEFPTLEWTYDCGGNKTLFDNLDDPESLRDFGNPIFVEGEGYEGACLFNVFEDPYELNRLDTSTPEYAAIALRLSERMEALTMTATPLEPVAEQTDFACDYVTDYWGGWLGPWIAIVVPGEGEEEDNGATDNGATAAAGLSIGLTLVAILVGWLIV